MSIVDNETFKSCFCDGSCHTTGKCGGDRRVGPGLVPYEQETFGPLKEKNAGDILREIANNTKANKKAEARIKASKMYEENYHKMLQEASEGHFTYLFLIPEFDGYATREEQQIAKELVDLLQSNGIPSHITGDGNVKASWN